MLSQTKETTIKFIRFFLLLAWFGVLYLCIVDLGQDRLTDPNDSIAIKGLVGSTIELRGEILEPQAYNIAPRLFWGVTIPLVVLFLIFIGHDSWRRICPMSTISQIPRWMGWQRKKGKGNQRRIALVTPNSFLARYAILIQFFLFICAVTARLTTLSANPEHLFGFTLIVFFLAFMVGMLYGGKTWCHYFCPMNPIQLVISGPRGLNAAKSVTPVGQSMCRKPGPEGDISNCVACNSPCPDVDMERNYWDKLSTSSRRIVVYGYLGTVLGFVHGMFAATGIGGYGPVIWYDSDWLAIGFAPFGTMLPIHRIFGSIVLMLSWVTICVLCGMLLERLVYLFIKSNTNDEKAKETARHRVMILFTLSALLSLIYLVALPGMKWLPDLVVTTIGFASTIALSIWAYRSWNRSSSHYQRENLGQSLLKRLQQVETDWPSQLEGRQLDDLSSEEIYLLANVTPHLEQKNRLMFYENFLSDVIQQGATNNSAGRRVLSQLRESCNISDDQHNNMINRLKAEYTIDDSLLISTQLRLNSFKQALENLLFNAISQGKPLLDAVSENKKDIENLKQDFSITVEEEEKVIQKMSSTSGSLTLAFEKLVEQLHEISQFQLRLNSQAAEIYLHRNLEHQAREIIIQCFGLIEMLCDTKNNQKLAIDITNAHPSAVSWTKQNKEFRWEKRLPLSFLDNLNTTDKTRTIKLLELSPDSVLNRLERFDDDYVSLVACRAAQLRDLNWANEALNSKLNNVFDPSVREKINSLISSNKILKITSFDGETMQFDGDITAGRAPDNQWIINQIEASRYHFRLFKENCEYFCEDLNSSNGTIVNNKIIQGDKVQLNKKNEIRVSYDSVPATIDITEVANQNIEHPVDLYIALANSLRFSTFKNPQLMKLVENGQVKIINVHGESGSTTLNKALVGFIIQGNLQCQKAGKVLTEYNEGDFIYIDEVLAEKSLRLVFPTSVTMIYWSLPDFFRITNKNTDFQLSLLNDIRKKLQSSIIELIE